MTLSVRPRPRLLPGAALLLGSALAVSGCVRHEDNSHASVIERAACARHADQVYHMRYPDEVYRADTDATSTRDAPFAGAGIYGDTTKGLSGRYERDQLVSDCLNGGGGTVGAAPEAPPPEEIPAATAAPAPAEPPTAPALAAPSTPLSAPPAAVQP
jgi:hypothetical protein